MNGSPSDDKGCRDFVANLARMLQAYKWKQADLARESKYSASVISELMSFKRWPDIQHGQAFDAAFGLIGMFEARAKEIRGGKAYAEAFKDFPAHEATAHCILIYQHSVYPGLFQTEGYGRSLLSTWPNITTDEVDRKWQGRLDRQKIVHRTDPPPPHIWALIDEAALRRPVAPPVVMYEQCMHAIELARLSHVSLAVVPYDSRGHFGPLGACTIVERDGIARVVNLEDFVDGRVTEDPALAREAAVRFRSLQGEALPTGASLDLMERLATELWTG
ncbi:MAG TPA: helix-turn-helix transcriptional regulator [Trebonia sp.]|nr:helix-turn-helix transcriptional regulator [Trebonia sp.]